MMTYTCACEHDPLTLMSYQRAGAEGNWFTVFFRCTWRSILESVRSQFDFISAGILSSFDFSVLSGCYDNTVKIHTLTGKELLTLPAHSAPVRCLCWISSGIVFCL